MSRPALPPSTVPLLLLLLLAGAWWWLERPDRVPDTVPLLDAPPDSVIALAWRSPTHRVLLRRDTGRWRLEGELRDAVDPAAVTRLLADLAAARAAVLAPAVGDSAGFGLLPDSPRLRVLCRDGRARGLRLGSRNPATGLVYGRLAGRPWLLGIATDALGRLTALPDAVRARELWPGFRWDAAETLRIARPGRVPAVLVSDGPRWWWRADTVPPDELPAWWPDWQRWYGDRRREDAAGTWWLCDRAAVRALLVELEQTRVKALVPGGEGRDTVLTVEVAGRYRGSRHRADFREPHGASLADAWRDGADVPVETIGRAVSLARRPARRFLATGVLAWPAADADSLAVVWTGIDSFRARRRGDAWEVVGVPDTGRPSPGETVADLVLRLDRLAVEWPTPPGAPERGPREVRFRITLWRSVPGAPRRERLLLGLLDGEPTAWSPEAGRRCRIGAGLLTTLRAIGASEWLAGRRRH